MGEYSLGDAMKYFLEKSRLKNGIRALQIEDIWAELMGNTIARYTDKIQIINQTLFIYTQVAPLKQELLYQKQQIIDRVNQTFGERVINEVLIR